MALSGIDLGGTKLVPTIFTKNGIRSFKDASSLENRKRSAVGNFITDLSVNSFKKVK